MFKFATAKDRLGRTARRYLLSPSILTVRGDLSNLDALGQEYDAGRRGLQVYDVIGIGVGPSNLGLAALLEKVPEVSALFLEKRKEFSWHEDSTLPNAQLQTSHLKDLVTMVDPTSRFTFLNYLVRNRLIYAFANRRVKNIYRKEFCRYFEWVARTLPNIRFSSEVQTISFAGDHFAINTAGSMFLASNIVLGAGIAPNLPSGVTLSATVFHSSTYAAWDKADFIRRRVIVVGGGQSGAEIVDDLCSGSGNALPAEINWITGRQNFFPLQDCSFSNEVYTPNYSRYFHGLPSDVRQKKNGIYAYTSDGITEELSNSIYNKIYYLKFVCRVDCRFSLLPHRRVLALETRRGEHRLSVFDLDTEGRSEVTGDIVILATGYREGNSLLLGDIFPKIGSLDDLTIRHDYSVDWPHPRNRIFIQNGCKGHFGLADPNLSLSSWRNAVIINALAGRDVYDVLVNSILYCGAEREQSL